MGLRYFFNNGAAALEERPEFGLSVFPAVDSYQIDRGRLEEDLRRFNVEAGVQFIEGKRVKDICLASEGQQPHTIFLENMPGSVAHNGGAAAPDTIHARWVIDAMGRRRYLQKKLKLVRETEAKCSAAWFHLEGRVDLCDLVASDSPWQTRVPNRQRYFSTNHLMGNGYWVWLIPLATNYTNVGIVTQESIHSFETFNTYARTQAWLRTHEPQLAEYIQHHTPLDFLCMRRYSYSSHQTFSEQRWACVGDAGVFADPFYSPGINLVGFANSITAEMIRLDFAEQLTAERVNEFNRYYIGMNDTLTTNIQLGYPFFGSAMPMAGKLLWDNSAAWAFNCPQMFNSIYLDPERSAQFRQATARFFSLTQRMQNLFVQWSMKRVLHAHKDYWLTAQHYGVDTLKLQETDRSFAVSKLFFTYGISGNLILPWYVGASIVLYAGPPRIVRGVLETIVRFQPTIFYNVPTGYISLLQLSDLTKTDNLSSLRLCISAGEPLPVVVWEKWQAATGLEIYEHIGCTETIAPFLTNAPSNVRAGSSGIPCIGYEVKIVDDAGLPVTAGEIGHLLIKGETTPLFYLHQYEKSQQTFQGEWYRTGDKYRVDADGFYWHEGRADDMMKVGGLWVSPVEVERVISSHPAVAECAVVAQRDQAEIMHPKVFIRLNQEQISRQQLLEELLQLCTKELTSHKRPRWFEFVDALPRTATGKLQRFKLRNQ